MADHDTTNSSAPAASKPKKTRNKLTPEQRIARLEQQLARAKSDQRKSSRKLQTRAKIILGAASLSYLSGLPAANCQTSLDKLVPFIKRRDRQALLDSGLLPDTVSLDKPGDTEKTDSGSESTEKDEIS